VRVAGVNQDVVTYRVSLRNDPEDLQRLIEFGNVLELEDFPRLSIGDEDQVILNYHHIDGGVNN
jgi:archaellum component FlaC